MWKLKDLRELTKPRIRTRESLPTPPRGMEWEQDEKTLQWRLIPDGGKGYSERPPRAPGSLEGKRVVVDGFPISSEAKLDDEDWDLLSEAQISVSSVGGAIVVTKTGSVRSLNSLDENSSHTTLSIPFKIHRTLSSSTIDSSEAERTLGLAGVDYLEHIVLPSDTLQGICLAYKISATRLRQVNQFSGNSLTSAPRKLIVPLSKKAIRTGFVKVQDTEAREYKVHAFLAELSSLKEAEAQAYLEMADWDLEEAVSSAREDSEWDKEIEPEAKSNDIHITVKLKDGLPVDLRTTGAGLKPQPTSAPIKPVTYDGLPSIATKNVRPQDVYNAAPQDQAYGMELKCLDN